VRSLVATTTVVSGSVCPPSSIPAVLKEVRWHTDESNCCCGNHKPPMLTPHPGIAESQQPCAMLAHGVLFSSMLPQLHILSHKHPTHTLPLGSSFKTKQCPAIRGHCHNGNDAVVNTLTSTSRHSNTNRVQAGVSPHAWSLAGPSFAASGGHLPTGLAASTSLMVCSPSACVRERGGEPARAPDQQQQQQQQQQ
jgi:hypothetical protein